MKTQEVSYTTLLDRKEGDKVTVKSGFYWTVGILGPIGFLLNGFPKKALMSTALLVALVIPSIMYNIRNARTLGEEKLQRLLDHGLTIIEE